MQERPDVFWSEHIQLFYEISFAGRVIDIDRRRESDTWRNNGYTRTNLPDDRFSYYDRSRDAIVIVQKSKIPVCRICMEVIPGLMPRVIPAEHNAKIRTMREPGMRDLLDQIEVCSDQESLVGFLWSRKVEELRALEAEYPQIEFRILQAFVEMDRSNPITASMVQQRTNLQMAQVMIALKNLAAKRPDMGQFFEDSGVFIFRKDIDAVPLLDEMLKAYRKNPENTVK